MNERAQAIEVLREAKAVLAVRLTEKVLEQAEDILADARGDSYMNEIDTVYEQVGLKLAHVSQMLANLPPEADTSRGSVPGEGDTFTVATEPAPSADAVIENTIPALTGPLYVAAPALPAPQTRTTGSSRVASAALQAFAAQIQAGDLLAAGRTLAALFEIEETRGVACAATFAQRVRHEAAFFRKVMELRGELHSANPQRALLLLLDCFGLVRGEAAEVLRNLQRRRT
ncbi:MAG TPA: hypothetical protein VFB80_03685 [Pirellulaceae bacterium]|nr:hypothetical protein [Pirellulaceae bacterium]